MDAPFTPRRPSRDEFEDADGAAGHGGAEIYGHDGEEELASSSVSIYTSSLSPLANYERGAEVGDYCKYAMRSFSGNLA
jgi:hypothetical protein